MVYLDYCATTFPDDEVLKEFQKASKGYVGNPNSSHFLGLNAKKRIDYATINISKILNISPEEIIYTSGASESNNLAIKGICGANKGKHIITTKLEHSSVIAPINRMCANGHEVSFVKLKADGTVDMEDLKKIIRNDTILVSIVAVDSELGIELIGDTKVKILVDENMDDWEEIVDTKDAMDAIEKSVNEDYLEKK